MGSKSRKKADTAFGSEKGLKMTHALLARLEPVKPFDRITKPRAKPPIPATWKLYPAGTRPDTDEARRQYPGLTAISDQLAHALAVRALRRGVLEGDAMDFKRAA